MGIQPFFPSVSDQPLDLSRTAAGDKLQLMSDCRQRAQIHPREALVDNQMNVPRNALAARSARQQRNAHRVEIPAGNEVAIRQDLVVGIVSSVEPELVWIRGRNPGQSP